MNIFMTIFSPRKTYFGRFQPREKSNYTRKKIISPVLERENPLRNTNVINYNKQLILMPPVKKPITLSINKTTTGRPRFLKDKTHLETANPGRERDSNLKKEAAVISQHKNTREDQRLPLKERIKVYEIHHKSGVDPLLCPGVDIISNVPLCRSTKYLQKYGCLHTDHVTNRWRL